MHDDAPGEPDSEGPVSEEPGSAEPSAEEVGSGDVGSGEIGPGGSTVEEPEIATWADLRTDHIEAMEWGIVLCGQLAEFHERDEVVGVISAETIVASDDGRPWLPDPDEETEQMKWQDLAALAGVIRDLVDDPPPELIDALQSPYASAVALAQELQDAQRDLGLRVTPIPYAGAPLVAVGGAPYEIPPENHRRMRPGSTYEEDEEDVEVEEEPQPDKLLLLAIVFVVLVLAVLLGVGWSNGR